ncbi:endo alpha-1,4 polygalactosaminidase [Guptibacillus hwajinpoensis]|uniref:endo alpha-1,4 polygalactosaminidase n=2 Tax=Guptibacillus hwajinpoensis TaxID=208199 RepID=UPI00384D2AF0
MGIISTKQIVAMSCAVLFTLVMISPLTSHAASHPLSDVTSYKVYYDAPTTRLITKMKQYDVMIIEPVYYSKQQISEIKSSGTKVYGYINTMEADNWNTALINQLNEDDFFHRNGERVHYTEWDSYLTDITSVHYRDVLLSEVTEQIADKGLDGVFLDTVGDIDNEHWENPTVLQAQQEGMVTFLQQIKQEHPSLSLIQNWGFQTLKNYTSPYVDAIMWENFNYSTVSKDEWSNDRMADLKDIQQETNLAVFTVSTEQKWKSISYAESNGFIHFHTRNGYNSW